ncbi:inositol monophosphatase family protein, partial [Elioraea sp.]|uniref:inositol monophosphatase family protein n=1 Tax=Elioraea sp. TaxID=2185103 RepID=UPI003F702A90
MHRAELARRCDIAAALAAEAAALAARMRAEGRGTASLKGTQDFLTEADGATERFLRDRLGALFPGEAVLGEEMGGEVAGEGPLWVLDPIDGTSNFARGGDRWCVSVGLVAETQAGKGNLA